MWVRDVVPARRACGADDDLMRTSAYEPSSDGEPPVQCLQQVDGFWTECEHLSEQKPLCMQFIKIRWNNKELGHRCRKMPLAAILARAGGIFGLRWEGIDLWITGGARKVPMQALSRKGPRASCWKD